MALHSTHKNSTKGKARTMARKATRQVKYAAMAIDGDRLIREGLATTHNWADEVAA